MRIGNMGAVVVTLLLILLIVVIFFHRDDRGKGKTGPGKGKVIPALANPEIDKVELDPPAATASDFIRAVPVLKNPEVRFVTFTYRWFVNGDAVVGGDKKLLEKNQYKKGDSVYCLVNAVRGRYRSKEVESNEIVVGNSPPVIIYVPIAGFEIPGEFKYKIVAEDPDGDPLTYTLLEPQNTGIHLDPETGDMSWYIDEKMREVLEGKDEAIESSGQGTGSSEEEESAGSRESKVAPPEPVKEEEKPTPYVRIVFQATDPDGAAAVGSININLLQGKEIPR